jgi:hypothetical protein
MLRLLILVLRRVRVSELKLSKTTEARVRRLFNLLIEFRNHSAIPLLTELYWGMILAPRKDSNNFDLHVKRRCKLFETGKWKELWAEIVFRTSFINHHNRNDDESPVVQLAKRCQYHITKHGSTSAVNGALNGPLAPPPTHGLLPTFQSLHPQVGDPLPPPPPHPPSAIDDTSTPLSPFEREHMDQRRPIVDPNFLKNPSPTESVSFTVEEYISRVRRGDDASAGGLNGMKYSILKLIFRHNDKLSQNYTVYLNSILANNITPNEKDLLNASRGVALPKSEQGDIRPIAVGHIILRMLGSMGLSTVSKLAQDFFMPIQFGVGVRNGCELMINAIRARLALNPGDICVSCDAKNAFNSFDRSKIWSPLRQHFPTMENFVRLAYLEGGNVAFLDGEHVEEVKSTVGSRQGCSLGSFLFCLAIHEELQNLQNNFPRLMIIAYCDDVYIVGEPKSAIEAYSCWSHAVATRLQGSLRDEKGAIYSTQLNRSQLLDLGCPPSMKSSTNGLKVLGAPIGDLDFVRTFIEDKIVKLEKHMDIIGHMTSHHAQWAVTVRSIQQRMQYIFRCVPCGNVVNFINLAARYDKSIISVLQRICQDQPLTTRATSIAYLPQNMGGFGLKSWFQTADAAFVASYVYAGTIIPTIFPNLTEAFPHPSPPPSTNSTLNSNVTNPISLQITLNDLIPDNALDAKQAAARIQADCQGLPLTSINNGATLRKVQSSFTKNIDKASLACVITSIKQDPSERKTQLLARLLSAAGDAFTWYTVPTDILTTLSNIQIRIAALQRLLIPIIKTNLSEEISRAKITCPKCNITCSTSPISKNNLANTSDIDSYGFHSFRCNADGHSSRTKLLHDTLRDVWLRLFKHAGFSATREPYGIMYDSNKRPDIAVILDDKMHNLILDVRTCDPLLSSCVLACSHQSGHAATLGAIQKDHAWLELSSSQGDLFQAICHEHPGLIGSTALAALDRAAAKFGQTPPQRNAFKTYWLQRLHMTNTRGVANVILQRLPFADQIRLPHTLPEPTLNHFSSSNPRPISAPYNPIHPPTNNLNSSPQNTPYTLF